MGPAIMPISTISSCIQNTKSGKFVREDGSLVDTVLVGLAAARLTEFMAAAARGGRLQLVFYTVLEHQAFVEFYKSNKKQMGSKLEELVSSVLVWEKCMESSGSKLVPLHRLVNKEAVYSADKTVALLRSVVTEGSGGKEQQAAGPFIPTEKRRYPANGQSFLILSSCQIDTSHSAWFRAFQAQSTRLLTGLAETQECWNL